VQPAAEVSAIPKASAVIPEASAVIPEASAVVPGARAVVPEASASVTAARPRSPKLFEVPSVVRGVGTFRYRSAAMQLSIPSFQFRFMKAQGNVIFPGNFHPVGAQRGSELAVQRALAGGVAEAGAGGAWLFVGGSGGFGSAARIAVGTRLGAHTLNVSFDPAPQPESGNKIRRIGSPGWHRNRAIERELRGLGRVAESLDGDAFDPGVRGATIDAIRAKLPGGKLSGLVWALAAPRGQDPRTGQVVASSLKPLGKEAVIRTFTGADDGGPFVDELTLLPGAPDEAVKTQYVMGGRIVEIWIDALLEAGVLAPGFTLLTISYRGSPTRGSSAWPRRTSNSRRAPSTECSRDGSEGAPTRSKGRRS
jgi:hypothetical protein